MARDALLSPLAAQSKTRGRLMRIVAGATSPYLNRPVNMILVMLDGLPMTLHTEFSVGADAKQRATFRTMRVVTEYTQTHLYGFVDMGLICELIVTRVAQLCIVGSPLECVIRAG